MKQHERGEHVPDQSPDQCVHSQNVFPNSIKDFRTSMSFLIRAHGLRAGGDPRVATRNSEKLTLIDINKVCPGSAGRRQPRIVQRNPQEDLFPGGIRLQEGSVSRRIRFSFLGPSGQRTGAEWTDSLLAAPHALVSAGSSVLSVTIWRSRRCPSEFPPVFTFSAGAAREPLRESTTLY